MFLTEAFEEASKFLSDFPTLKSQNFTVTSCTHPTLSSLHRKLNSTTRLLQLSWSVQLYFAHKWFLPITSLLFPEIFFFATTNVNVKVYHPPHQLVSTCLQRYKTLKLSHQIATFVSAIKFRFQFVNLFCLPDISRLAHILSPAEKRRRSDGKWIKPDEAHGIFGISVCKVCGGKRTAYQAIPFISKNSQCRNWCNSWPKWEKKVNVNVLFDA